MMKKVFRNIILYLFLILSLSIAIPISSISGSSTGDSLRRTRTAYLEYLLEALSPEVIAGIESQHKFVVHSGPSAVGQGTIKQRMLELYPDRFQRFLLYATRQRRGVNFTSSDPRYSAIKLYLDLSQQGNLPSSMKELLDKLSPEQREAILTMDKTKQDELEEVLFPDWKVILAGSPRQDIPAIEERFQILTDGRIIAYTEFNGVHYWFVSQEELFRLRDEEGIIVEPVRDYYQGLDPRKIEEATKKGNGKIVILEGDRVWFDHVRRLFPEATSIFIAPISIKEFKRRMIMELGLEYQEEVEGLDVQKLLRGGIEKFIAQELPNLISFPEGLTPEENKAFLNVKNAILAAIGYKILHPDSDIYTWLQSTGLLKESDLTKVNSKLSTPLNLQRVVDIANDIYGEIARNQLLLTAMKVIIREMVGRIEHRLRAQGRNPQDWPLLGETYVRASQSPREYGGSADYDEIVVNEWEQLDSSTQSLTVTILESLLPAVLNEVLEEVLNKEN
ncbi:MAG: hypothetical protein AB7E08_00055 [Candidatus Omnitrophota bacterium]